MAKAAPLWHRFWSKKWSNLKNQQYFGNHAIPEYLKINQLSVVKYDWNEQINLDWVAKYHKSDIAQLMSEKKIPE